MIFKLNEEMNDPILTTRNTELKANKITIDTLTCDILDVLEEHGYDADADDVIKFAEHEADILWNTRGTLNAETWYEETEENYPEDLAELTKKFNESLEEANSHDDIWSTFDGSSVDKILDKLGMEERYELTGSVTIPDGVTEIKAWAFSNCTNITSVTIPDSVTSIGNHAFYLCTNLASITVPDSVTDIHRKAFSRCDNITFYTNNPYVIKYCKTYGFRFRRNKTKSESLHESYNDSLKNYAIELETGEIKVIKAKSMDDAANKVMNEYDIPLWAFGVCGIVDDDFAASCGKFESVDIEEGCHHDRKEENMVIKEVYDDSLYVDIDELIGTIGRALEEGTRNPDVFAELADVYGRLVEMRDAGYQLNTVHDESLKESRLGEGNPVSHELPSSIDLFLQDVAQTTGQISYNDIAKFAKSGFTSEDLKALKKLHRVYADDTSWEDDNDDLVLNDVGRKVAMIVKKKDENCHIVNL